MASPRLLSPSFSALLVANVCFGYAFSSFLLLPKYLSVALGGGPADVGALTAAHGAVVVLALPLMGVAVDRLGRRRFLVAGALLMLLATLGYALIDSVGPLLYALRILQAVSFAMVFAAGGALVVDLAPPERLGQAIGVYGLSFLSMNAVAPAVVESVALARGWSTAFGTAAFGALLCALLAQRIQEPQRPAADGADRSLLEVARRPGLLATLLVIALVGSALSAVFNFHQLYAIELGIERVSAFFVAYSATAITVRVGFGHLMDQWGHRRVSAGALVLYTVVVFAVSRLGDVGLVPLGAGLGAAHGVFYPSFNAVALAAARAGERGRVMALFQAAFQTGMATGGLVFGLIADRAGYPPVFHLAAAGLLLALLVLVASTPRPASP